MKSDVKKPKDFLICMPPLSSFTSKAVSAIAGGVQVEDDADTISLAQVCSATVGIAQEVVAVEYFNNSKNEGAVNEA